MRRAHAGVICLFLYFAGLLPSPPCLAECRTLPPISSHASQAQSVYDGTYAGKIHNINVDAVFAFTIAEGSINGSFSGPYGDASHPGTTMSGTFSGTVDSAGNVKAKLTVILNGPNGSETYEGSVHGLITRRGTGSGSLQFVSTSGNSHTYNGFWSAERERK